MSADDMAREDRLHRLIFGVAYGPDVEVLSRRMIGESDRSDTERILDALPDLLRADGDAGDALRARLGKCPTPCDCEEACHEGHEVLDWQRHDPIVCTLLVEALL